MLRVRARVQFNLAGQPTDQSQIGTTRRPAWHTPRSGAVKCDTGCSQSEPCCSGVIARCRLRIGGDTRCSVGTRSASVVDRLKSTVRLTTGQSSNWSSTHERDHTLPGAYCWTWPSVRLGSRCHRQALLLGSASAGKAILSCRRGGGGAVAGRVPAWLSVCGNECSADGAGIASERRNHTLAAEYPCRQSLARGPLPLRRPATGVDQATDFRAPIPRTTES